VCVGPMTWVIRAKRAFPASSDPVQLGAARLTAARFALHKPEAHEPGRRSRVVGTVATPEAHRREPAGALGKADASARESGEDFEIAFGEVDVGHKLMNLLLFHVARHNRVMSPLPASPMR